MFALPKKDRGKVVPNLVEKVIASGAIEQSKEKAESLIDDSIKDIKSIQKNNVYSEALIDLAISSKNREK
jgi:geranylgeranyl pyrophosphate synthase